MTYSFGMSFFYYTYTLLITTILKLFYLRKNVTTLKTVVENGEGSLDKETTSQDELFDASRLSLQYWVSN
jgi:hypothetical protein